MHIVMARLPGNICERHTGGQGFGPTMCSVQRVQKHRIRRRCAIPDNQLYFDTASAEANLFSEMMKVRCENTWRGAVRGNLVETGRVGV